MAMVPGSDGQQRLADLTVRFRQQQQFATGYSPLYAALFGTVADWLTSQSGDSVVEWLLEETAEQPAFEVTNLLAAGLHYEVLKGREDVADLAAFYPSVGGDASPERLFQGGDQDQGVASQEFVQALHGAILARQGPLASFVHSHAVQTNETGRGICWLLPLHLSGLKQVHLLDVGASAGLNLIADQRAFEITMGENGEGRVLIGSAAEKQFVLQSVGWDMRDLLDLRRPPEILSRVGCDARPFLLAGTEQEQVLASFVWADQGQRLQRLREAIASLRQIQQSEAPVQLYRVSLPDELPYFLEEHFQNLKAPLFIYNTYIKVYLPNKGAALRTLIERWAPKARQPVVWLQWEPPRYTIVRRRDVPHFGWLAWTADIWHNTTHDHFHLAWVQPHGRQAEWLPGIRNWNSFWS